MNSLGRFLTGALSLAVSVLPLAVLRTICADGGGMQTSEVLGNIVPDTEMNAVPLRDAINYVQQDSGANIYVNWNALSAVGVSNLTPITLSLQNVTVGKLLALIMAQASPETPTVEYVDSNVLMITTRADADTQMVTRVYNVSDLIMSVPDYSSGAPTLSLALQNQSVNASSTGGGGGGGQTGSNLFGGGGQTSQGAVESPAQRGQELVKLIETIVYPSIWADNGGQASIVYFNSNLIITAPEYIQEQIGG